LSTNKRLAISGALRYGAREIHVIDESDVGMDPEKVGEVLHHASSAEEDAIDLCYP